MSNCVFCRILAGELDGSFVHRGQRVSAFLDINPITPGHVLIVPNDHVERFTGIDPVVAAEMMEMAQKVLRAITKTDLRCEGANIFLSDGEVAGQEVPHSHLHIAPRFRGDGQRMGFNHADPGQVKRATLNSIATKITQKL
jgi:histidine triad (HIT) family protein